MAEIALSLILFMAGNSPPVITACREVAQVIWPMEKGTVQWPIMWGGGKITIMQMRQSKSRRGIETNIYER
jgi:hypothetical protein